MIYLLLFSLTDSKIYGGLPHASLPFDAFRPLWDTDINSKEGKVKQKLKLGW